MEEGKKISRIRPIFCVKLQTAELLPEATEYKKRRQLAEINSERTAVAKALVHTHNRVLVSQHLWQLSKSFAGKLHTTRDKDSNQKPSLSLSPLRL